MWTRDVRSTVNNTLTSAVITPRPNTSHACQILCLHTHTLMNMFCCARHKSGQMWGCKSCTAESHESPKFKSTSSWLDSARTVALTDKEGDRKWRNFHFHICSRLWSTVISRQLQAPTGTRVVLGGAAWVKGLGGLYYWKWTLLLGLTERWGPDEQEHTHTHTERWLQHFPETKMCPFCCSSICT